MRHPLYRVRKQITLTFQKLSTRKRFKKKNTTFLFNYTTNSLFLKIIIIVISLGNKTQKKYIKKSKSLVIHLKVLTLKFGLYNVYVMYNALCYFEKQPTRTSK